MGKLEKQMNARNHGKDSIGEYGDTRVLKARPPKKRPKLKPFNKGFGDG
uniref:Uncharacterized protein n=1 Tax=uncultured organism MedDCM-OCT-S09-C20 TaxID=743645 RepID=D6PKY0_9ZZZZ|nr:hypothetical protein [uncultured organism MedDCM-OCT-S09-C20]